MKLFETKYGYIIGLIIIGVIGSGFWDLIVKDLLYFLANLFIFTVSLIYSGYIDFLYEDVGKSAKTVAYIPTLLILIFISITIIFFPYFLKNILKRLEYIINQYEGVQRTNENLDLERIENIKKLLNHKKKLLISIVLFSIVMFLIYVHMIINITIRVNTESIIDRYGDILRPEISQIEYFEIVGDYRASESLNDYLDVLNKIDNYSSDSGVKLPCVGLLGISTDKYKNINTCN